MGRLLLIVLLLQSTFVRAEDARLAIAQFDTVPAQIITESFSVGVMAFHIGGISSVAFSITDGTNTVNQTVSTESLNSRTLVKGYVIAIDPTVFIDGPITVTATATPRSPYQAETRVITLSLFADSGATWRNAEIRYVSVTGSDETGDGTVGLPYASVEKALYEFKGDNNGTIILLDAGTYYMAVANNNFSPRYIPSWVVVKPADGLGRDDVIITCLGWGFIRPTTGYLKFERVSFDFDHISQFYNEADLLLWFDNVRWFSAKGHDYYVWDELDVPWIKPIRDSYYVTESLATDKCGGFIGATLVRNSVLQNVTCDVIQEAQVVVNTVISNSDDIFDHHLDIYQDIFGGVEDNIILLNIIVSSSRDPQNFFLEPNENYTTEPPLSNMIVKDMYIVNEENTYAGPNTGGPAYSQLMGQFVHIIFDNVYMPWQQLLFRDDVNSGLQAFSAADVILKNVTLHHDTYDKYIDTLHGNYVGLPAGVSFTGAIRAPDLYGGDSSTHFKGLGSGGFDQPGSVNFNQ